MMVYLLILKHSKRWMNNKGITLVEILIVVAIMGVLIAMATWSGQDMWSSFRIRGAAREVYGDMQMARLNSIKDGKVWGVQFAGNSYTVRNSGADLVIGNGDDVILKRVNLVPDFPGINVSPICGGADMAVFNPNGTAICAGNRVTLFNATRTQSICINTSTGNIKVVNGAACV